MAEIESKNVRLTNPSEQNIRKEIEFSFGWYLDEAYDITKEGKSYIPGSSYHHVELKFKRNPSIPHYLELKKLENQYWSSPDPDDPPKFFGDYFQMVIGGMGCLPMLLALAVLPIGIPIWIISYPIKKANWKKNKHKRAELLKEARVLSNRWANIILNIFYKYKIIKKQTGT